MKNRVGFAFNLIILILIILFVSMGSLTVMARYRTDRLAVRQIESNNKLLLASLDWAISPLIQAKDFKSIQRLIENIGVSRAVTKLQLYDAEFLIVASADPTEVGISRENPIARKIFTDGVLFAAGSEGSMKQYTFGVPIRGEVYKEREKSDIMAALIITGNPQYYKKLYVPVVNAISYAAIILAVLLSLFAYLYIRATIITPLSKLMQAVEEVEKGNYYPDFSVKKPPEFKRFAEMVGAMLDEILDKNKALKEYSDTLELKVEERTRELELSLTDLHNAQKTMIRQEKMASIGRLSAGVAHEINNPTGFVIGNINALREYIEVFKSFYSKTIKLTALLERTGSIQDGNNIHAALEQVKKLKEEEDIDFIMEDLNSLTDELDRGMDRIKNIVQGLRDFSRDDSDVYEFSNINIGLENALKIVWNKVKYKATVTKALGTIPKIRCNIRQLEQVFVNLLTNAADAIEKNGTISIKTETDGPDVVITVSDTGCGMEPEIAQHIFDPFFTTKEVGGGTGLGLSISYGIIENHGGQIEVASEPGIGTVFTIRMPVTRKDDQ